MNLLTALLVVGLALPCMGQLAEQNGDLDGDGHRNQADAHYLMAYIFSGGPPPVPFADAANGDVDGSGSINMSDFVYMWRWMNAGGPEPVEFTCVPKLSATPYQY